MASRLAVLVSFPGKLIGFYQGPPLLRASLTGQGNDRKKQGAKQGKQHANTKNTKSYTKNKMKKRKKRKKQNEKTQTTTRKTQKTTRTTRKTTRQTQKTKRKTQKTQKTPRITRKTTSKTQKTKRKRPLTRKFAAPQGDGPSFKVDSFFFGAQSYQYLFGFQKNQSAPMFDVCVCFPGKNCLASGKLRSWKYLFASRETHWLRGFQSSFAFRGD